MLTILLVKAALLPLPIYALGVWLGYPFEGSLIGLVYGVAWALWRHKGKIPPPFEAALLAGLAIGVIGLSAGIASIAANTTAIVLLALSIGAVISIAIGEPWTSAFSASSFQGASRTQAFKSINTQISALWAVLFAWLGFASLFHLPREWEWATVAAGAIASIALPRLLTHRALSAIAAGDRRNDWPAPDFGVTTSPSAGFDDTTDVAVVGAGIGGLTAAALLAAHGLKVDVYEHHVVPGGFAHTWLRRTRDPVTHEKLVFRFDSGVHDVSGWHPGGTVRSIFERLHISDHCKWQRLDHRYILDGRTLDVPRDWRAYARELGALYPGEASAVAALFEDIHTVYVAMFSTARDRSGIPGTPSSPQALLEFAKSHSLAAEWMSKPWEAFVARHVKDPGPRKWISALAGYVTEDQSRATVADMVPLFGYYFEGGYYPIGGSGRIADSLVTAIERHGGRVHLKTPVEKILSENGAATGLVVHSAPGQIRRIKAKAIVCNADLRRLLSSLLDDSASARQLAVQVGALQSACSAMGVHLGIRGRLDLPPVVHCSTPNGSVGMVIPTAVDSSAAPAGYSTLELLTLLPNSKAKSWFPREPLSDNADYSSVRSTTDYETRKRAIGDALIARARSVIPDLDTRIVFRTESSPLTYSRYSWTHDGSIYGTRAGTAIPIKMPLRNLVLAGAATHGPGVEAVVISGALAAEALVPGLLSAAT